MTVYDNETFRIITSLGNASIDEFDDRLRLQKLGYLAQKMGSVGGFMFSWYIRGPYSPSLTKLLYDAEDSGMLDTNQSPTLKERQIIEKIEILVGKDRLSDPILLELYASVWYLLPDKITKKDSEHVIRVFRKTKPDFKESEVINCITKIEQFRQIHGESNTCTNMT